MEKYFAEKNFSINSTKTYIYWIKKFLKWSSGSISEEDLIAYRENVMKEYSVGTQKVVISALKCLIEYNEIELNLKVPNQKTIYDISIIDSEEYNFIASQLIWENSLVSIRNKEMIKVMWFTGMRISEIINLRWEDIANGTIKIESKNNKKRFIPFKDGLFDTLLKQKNQSMFSQKIMVANYHTQQ